LQQHPSGIYYFRLIVPQHLREPLGRKVIKQSLQTRDPVVAKLLAYTLAAHHLPSIKSSRAMDFKKALEALQKGQGRTYSITTPQGFTVNANGPEDHQRAMEALQVLTGGVSNPPPPTQPQRGNSGSGNPIQLQEAARKYLATLKSTAVRKTFISRQRALADLTHWAKPKTPVNQITRTDLAEFHQFLINQQQAKPTIALKFGFIKQFFTYCQNAGYYPTQDNPAEGQVSYTKRDRSFRKKLGFEPFTAEETQQITSNLNPKKPQKYWPVWIGLYTGARVNEVAQLALADFTTIDGLPCFTITDEGAEQKLKNQDSRRTIPIHPKLVELGLLEYVKTLQQQGETRLFPKLTNAINGYGNAISKAFSRYLKELNIKPKTGKKGFHSFRKTITHKMQTAMIAPDIRAQYLGHDLDDEHYQAYSRKYTPRELAEVIFKALD
jgi:integrase